MTNHQIINRERKVIATLLHDVEQDTALEIIRSQGEYMREAVENCNDTAAIANHMKAVAAGAC